MKYRIISYAAPGQNPMPPLLAVACPEPECEALPGENCGDLMASGQWSEFSGGVHQVRWEMAQFQLPEAERTPAPELPVRRPGRTGRGR